MPPHVQPSVENCPACSSSDFIWIPVEFVPGVVLDPFFGGSWRLARVALNLGRNVIGIDMKEEYLKMAKDIAIYGEKGLGRERKAREQGITQKPLGHDFI